MVYNLGFAIFTIGSGLCVFADTGQQLIVFRIIQGLGGSMLIANSAALITDATPARELRFALGINQIALTLGAVSGLTIGGVLIDITGRRSMFALNVPIGIFATLWSHLRLREIKAHQDRRRRFRTRTCRMRDEYQQNLRLRENRLM
jgi:MFS family permease